jgi:AcrR family transcriptional regulator
MLSEQHVIEAALRLVQRSGIDKLSVRAIARELGVTPMALYRYVPSKEALLDRVRDWALAMASNVSVRPRSTRPRRKAPLSVESIVEAGLRVARGRDVETLTMRAVAEQLGVSTMALYYHVPDKERLLDRMRERLLEAVPTPEPQARDWEAQMKTYALASIQQMAAYPGLLRYSLKRPPTRADLKLASYGISILLAAGFGERAAALAITAFHAQIIGIVIMHSIREESRAGARAQPAAKGRPVGVAGVGQYMAEMDFLASTEYGLETTLAGLRAELAKTRSGKSAARRP